jgi:hypothetical protein
MSISRHWAGGDVFGLNIHGLTNRVERGKGHSIALVKAHSWARGVWIKYSPGSAIE